MPEESKDMDVRDEESDVVDQLLTDLGVDEEMRKELVKSGRASEDIIKVEPADQVRRRIEIKKSLEQLRTSLNQVERTLLAVDGEIDKIERNLLPVVLSFLVNLKGNLVTLKTTIVGRSKRRTKTNLQENFVKTVVSPVVDEEFARVEGMLDTEMSAPILDKVREITDGLKEILKRALEDMATLKATVDDYSQRAITEMEFLSKELSMKPRIEIPRETVERIKQLKRKVEELTRELALTQQQLENREAEIDALKKRLEETQLLNESLENTIASLRATAGTDSSQVVELRQQLKSLEASREILKAKLDDAQNQIAAARQETHEFEAKLAQKELECDDLRTKIAQLEQEAKRYQARLSEVEDLREKIKLYESGELRRELERLRSEYERVSAAYSRLQKEQSELKQKFDETTARLEGYLGVMGSSDKTKAFLILEETGRITIREISRSLGISPAQVCKWAEDFEKLGVARVVNGDTLELTLTSKDNKNDTEVFEQTE